MPHAILRVYRGIEHWRARFAIVLCLLWLLSDGRSLLYWIRRGFRQRKYFVATHRITAVVWNENEEKISHRWRCVIGETNFENLKLTRGVCSGYCRWFSLYWCHFVLFTIASGVRIAIMPNNRMINFLRTDFVCAGHMSVWRSAKVEATLQFIKFMNF